MKRRTLLTVCGGSLLGGYASHRLTRQSAITPSLFDESSQIPTGVHSITPVVGDGNWIWNDPPEETGYLEPREYEVEIGIEFDSRSGSRGVQATTPIPVELPEQKIESASVETNGCSATIRQVSGEAAQLLVAAPMIAAGATVSAVAKMRLTLFKQYHGFDKERFDTTQPAQPLAFKQQYLFDSPGIEVRAPQVRKMQTEITTGVYHPWDKAHKIYEWVWENIHARIGNYTSVLRALKSRVGDCEERAACFVAMCRSAGIPARLVWVPNHNWAEFYLVDTEGKGHWIPAHTAAYSWFGWTGAHELVIQKGDNLRVPEKRSRQRLLADWARWQGARPKVRYLAHIKPIAEGSQDPGPGERIKDRQGKWVLQRSHSMDARLRDGANSFAVQRR